MKKYRLDWADIFLEKSMWTLIFVFLPVGLMIAGAGTTYWMWCYIFAFIIFVIGDYFK
jgi:hypothetical protein